MRHGQLLALLLAASTLLGCGQPQDRVVLYCAQDKEFADSVLGDFTKATGLRVDAKYDTEADKSVSLYTELVQERKRPRCDVHWNNEILSTIRLQRQGVLDVYRSPSAEPYPAFAKASDGTWQAFAARARILLVNRNLVREADDPKSLLDLAHGRWKGRLVMAKPQYGTTATHAACLFEVLGEEKAKEFYRSLLANGIHIVAGNKQVAEGIGQGLYAIGMTDTDDAFGEIEAGKPVAMLFPDRDRPAGDRMGTLFIPNTLAVVRGSPNPVGAKRLVDYLLGAEIETRLAENASHQLPLNPNVNAKLPKELATPKTAHAMQVNFEKAADLWESVQEFLRNEFAR